MRLDELEWRKPARNDVNRRRAHFTTKYSQHTIVEHNDGTFSVGPRGMIEWGPYNGEYGACWHRLDPIAAQAVVYHLFAEKVS